MQGILFKEDVFKAIIEGKKTQTRKIIKPQPAYAQLLWEKSSINYKTGDRGEYYYLQDKIGTYFPDTKPRYQLGDIVYLKEPYCNECSDQICYRFTFTGESRFSQPIWKNKLFMPATHARYFILITKVRIERLQDIREKDAKHAKLSGPFAEVVKRLDGYIDGFFKKWQSIGFFKKWQSINGPESFACNYWVWVWVYEFRLCQEIEVFKCGDCGLTEEMDFKPFLTGPYCHACDGRMDLFYNDNTYSMDYYYKYLK